MNETTHRTAWGLVVGLVAGAVAVSAQYPAQSQVAPDGTTVVLEDYVDLPVSSPTHGGVKNQVINYAAQLGRVNVIRSEPAAAPRSRSRLLVDDQSGTLYFLDKTSKQFTPYLRFPDLFPRFVSDTGLATGIVSVAFAPDYATSGKFYTVHIEKPDMAGLATISGYSVTPVVVPPLGTVRFESVLVEWTDTNIRNATFEGTARELLRVGYERNHPVGEVIFNPTARPGTPDYGNLYIASGDGAQGEAPGAQHLLPQRLDNLMGKILRIRPDLTPHAGTVVSANGRYRIPIAGPDANPLVAVPGSRPEIYAYGFRNPHRLAWDLQTKTLLADDIGLHAWEEVDIVTKGGNFGYAEREGHEQVFVDKDHPGVTGSRMVPPVPFPDPDVLTVDGQAKAVVPVYPVVLYSHQDGDSIGSGVVYRGKRLPQLRGKYVFNDMTSGRIFFADFAEMIAAGGQRNHQAAVHELQVIYKGEKRRMFDIVAEAFARKGGTHAANHLLPANAPSTNRPDRNGVPMGGGRVDIRIAEDGDGELYVLGKTDGTIRAMVK